MSSQVVVKGCSWFDTIEFFQYVRSISFSSIIVVKIYVAQSSNYFLGRRFEKYRGTAPQPDRPGRSADQSFSAEHKNYKRKARHRRWDGAPTVRKFDVFRWYVCRMYGFIMVLQYGGLSRDVCLSKCIIEWLFSPVF